MSIIKRIYSFVRAIPVSMLIMVGMLAIGPISIVITNVYGTTQTVTVSFHKTVHAKGKSPHIASCGYYYVKGKRYAAQIGKKLPIGTKFEIKYSRLIPCENDVVRIIQE